MTIEEKAKAYDDALERARNIRFGNPNNAIANVVCEDIFPELKDSKDEWIKREIINYLKEKGDFRSCWIAWLEKQGEQKSYTFNSIPRLLGMIKPIYIAKEYCQKLIDSLEKEGYNADAKIVRGILKQWNGDAKNFFFNDLNIQGRANKDEMSVSKTCDAAIKYCLENLI